MWKYEETRDFGFLTLTQIMYSAKVQFYLFMTYDIKGANIDIISFK